MLKNPVSWSSFPSNRPMTILNISFLFPTIISSRFVTWLNSSPSWLTIKNTGWCSWQFIIGKGPFITSGFFHFRYKNVVNFISADEQTWKTCVPLCQTWFRVRFLIKILWKIIGILQDFWSFSKIYEDFQKYIKFLNKISWHPSKSASHTKYQMDRKKGRGKLSFPQGD